MRYTLPYLAIPLNNTCGNFKLWSLCPYKGPKILRADETDRHCMGIES